MYVKRLAINIPVKGVFFEVKTGYKSLVEQQAVCYLEKQAASEGLLINTTTLTLEWVCYDFTWDYELRAQADAVVDLTKVKKQDIWITIEDIIKTELEKSKITPEMVKEELEKYVGITSRSKPKTYLELKEEAYQSGRLERPNGGLA